MDKDQEKLEAQQHLANIFFEMGMEEDVVATITGLSKEETNRIKNKKKEKENYGIDLNN